MEICYMSNTAILPLHWLGPQRATFAIDRAELLGVNRDSAHVAHKHTAGVDT